MPTLGLCRNPECAKAASGEPVEFYAGPGQYCPECGKALEAIPLEVTPLEVAPLDVTPHEVTPLEIIPLEQPASVDRGALVAENLRKRYGARDVVDGVTIRVAPGEIV